VIKVVVWNQDTNSFEIVLTGFVRYIWWLRYFRDI